VAQVTLFDASLFKNFEAAHLARLFLVGAGIGLAWRRPAERGTSLTMAETMAIIG
jgi:hypothetical protein